MSSNARQLLEQWLRQIDVKADRVLDVGAAQNLTKGRTKSWDVGEYKILDLEYPHEKKYLPNYVGDINESLRYEMHIPPFDVIFCLEVFEYLWFPLNALYNMNEWLKPNGILYLSTHFLYKIHPPNDLDYLRYTPAGIEKLLEKSGFKILEHDIKSCAPESMFHLQQFFSSEGMRGKTQYPDATAGSLIKCQKI